MKAISTGNTYRIYDDCLKTYDKLPSLAYSVRFSEMSGFFLEERLGIEITEDKIYGAFELNQGETFDSAIKDLNIINMRPEEYNIALYYDNGMKAEARGVLLDMFNDLGSETFFLTDANGCNFVDVSFNAINCVFDAEKMAHIVYPDNLELCYSGSKDKNTVELVNKAQKANTLYLAISKKRQKDLHYTV